MRPLLLAAGLVCVLAIRSDEAIAAAMLGVHVGAQQETGIPLGVYDDVEGGPCSVSFDGLLWYRLVQGRGAPIEARFARCQSTSTLRSDPAPPIPRWARPSGPTKAIFVATSLQENYGAGGMQALHRLAAPLGIPLTWMMRGWGWIEHDYELRNAYHFSSGDDVQTELGILDRERQILPWIVPTVSIESGGRERRIPEVLRRGLIGFWGITWNSLGTDGNSDRGAPWGAYCADPSSYKHIDPSGKCPLVAFEWTARDLTRGYLSGLEDSFSTDPDDLRLRGGFTPDAAAAYVRAIVDAYAAAGESEPLVVVSQQETNEEAGDEQTGDAVIMGALYARAKADGLRALTLSAAAHAVQPFGGRPRAVAFPFISGGRTHQTLHCDASPSTIDYVDAHGAFTFVAGSALPARAFVYRHEDPSVFNRPVPQLPEHEVPQLVGVARTPDGLSFHFRSAQPVHYALALWNDPAAIGLARSAGIVPAGRAGAVLVFDLPRGESQRAVRCAHCDPANLTLAQ